MTLIDAGDAFVFGYSKLDVMFGRTGLDAVRLPYSAISKPGVRFVQERVTAIDPERKSATTDGGTYEGDFLVVALGADYDFDAHAGARRGERVLLRRGRGAAAPRCCPGSRAAARSSASATRRSSARPRRASARCCCTTT